MAFGGVATGNMKAQLALSATPAEIPNKGIPISRANSPIKGIRRLTRARFDMSSVENKAIETMINTRITEGNCTKGVNWVIR